MSTEGQLSAVIRAALAHRDAQRLAGATPDELARNFAATVRAVWPFTREWKYLCQGCSDTGLELHQCPGDASCGRHSAHGPHDYGRACWCQLGARFRERPKRGRDDGA